VQPYAHAPLIPGVELPKPPTPDEAPAVPVPEVPAVPGVTSF